MGSYARANRFVRKNADLPLGTATALVELGQCLSRSGLQEIKTLTALSVNVPSTFVTSNPYYVGMF